MKKGQGGSGGAEENALFLTSETEFVPYSASRRWLRETFDDPFIVVIGMVIGWVAALSFFLVLDSIEFILHNFPKEAPFEIED